MHSLGASRAQHRAQAAFKDDRFKAEPITSQEVPDIAVHISALGANSADLSADQLVPYKNGLS